MIRLSARWRSALGALVLASAAAGCASHAVEAAGEAKLLYRFEDQTPAHVPDGALDAVVLQREEQRRLYPSGVVLGPVR